MNIGKTLKQKRKELNITQEELSTISNISQSNISKYENNIITPPIQILIELCNILEIDIKKELF